MGGCEGREERMGREDGMGGWGNARGVRRGWEGRMGREGGWKEGEEWEGWEGLEGWEGWVKRGGCTLARAHYLVHTLSLYLRSRRIE
jgi:hypothetical protein